MNCTAAVVKDFSRLLEECGFSGRHDPNPVACGGREATFDQFKAAHKAKGKDDYVAMLLGQ